MLVRYAFWLGHHDKFGTMRIRFRKTHVLVYSGLPSRDRNRQYFVVHFIYIQMSF